MPRKKRDLIKRQAAQTFLALENTMTNMVQLHHHFDGVHPDKAEMLKTMCQSLMITDEALEKFCLVCWGMTKEKLESYRK